MDVNHIANSAALSGTSDFSSTLAPNLQQPNSSVPVRSKNSIPLDIIGREFPRSPGVRFFMQTGLDPFRFVIIAVAGWMNQHQQHAIDYLLEENRVLREQIGSRRIRFSDDQRCRLAAKA